MKWFCTTCILKWYHSQLCHVLFQFQHFTSSYLSRIKKICIDDKQFNKFLKEIFEIFEFEIMRDLNILIAEAIVNQYEYLTTEGTADISNYLCHSLASEVFDSRIYFANIPNAICVYYTVKKTQYNFQEV